MKKEGKFNEIYTQLLNYYNEELIKLKEIMAKERKRNLYTLLKVILFIIIFNIILFIIKPFNNVISVIILIDILALPMICVWILNTKDKQINQRIKIRKSITNNLIKCVSENIQYMQKEGIPLEIYNEAGIEQYTSYNSNNLMIYNIKDEYQLKMAEIQTSYQIGETNKVCFLGMFSVVNISTLQDKTIYIKRDFENKKIDKDLLKLSFDSSKVELDSRRV